MLNRHAIAHLHQAVAAFARASDEGLSSANAVANRIRQEDVEQDISSLSLLATAFTLRSHTAEGMYQVIEQLSN